MCGMLSDYLFFVKQKTSDEMRISDWSSDVCSSDLPTGSKPPVGQNLVLSSEQIRYCLAEDIRMDGAKSAINNYSDYDVDRFNAMVADYNSRCGSFRYRSGARSEEHTSELQSLMRISYAVFCLKKKKHTNEHQTK